MSKFKNDANDPMLESWVESANHAACDFPIQNLPFGRFHLAEGSPLRIGVAIGEFILDLRAVGLIDHADMKKILGLSRADRTSLRQKISEGLRHGSDRRESFERALIAQGDVQFGLPCEIREYTDFYVGVHHARAVGRQFRPQNPLLPNYQWVPIGYHGRASTINPTRSFVIRPSGQIKLSENDQPIFAPTRKLDFELELGIIVGQGNNQGAQVKIEQAEEHFFGLTLFNDWSARDIQAWEYQPLGPFLSKNFASTISPWVVTQEALEPFRMPFRRLTDDPVPLPYLTSERNSRSGAIDVHLEVVLQTKKMASRGERGSVISRSNFADAAYWTVAQLLAHHTSNGCALNAGDLLGTGTLSGAAPDQAGSMLELASGGTRPLSLPDGEQRLFIEDGDTVILRGYCQKDGYRRIGFGECRSTVTKDREKI